MTRFLLLLILLTVCAANYRASAQPAAVRTGALSAPEAAQAAAADEHFVYAISSEAIAKYDRATGQRLAVSTTAPGSEAAHHLNSGFLWQGKIYCAHSNYPKKPEKSQIMALDTETMQLGVFKDFGESHGSLTWAIREGDFWWCNFAYYGADNAKTVLVKLDDQWKELGSWTYPPQIIKEMGQMSISGGIWQNGQLLVTGHDKRALYRLRLPQQGSILEFVDTIRSPFPGQGIAVDPKTGGLVGIDRANHEVVFAELRP